METKKPTLGEVKEYFKNAKEIKSPYNCASVVEIDSLDTILIAPYGYEIKSKNNFLYNTLYDFEIKKYAEIISYKKETSENIGHLETPKHYDNSKGSIYQFCENQNLNSYEFDIIKRVVRCRKKGNFKEDLEKTKHLIDLYLKEYENNGNA